MRDRGQDVALCVTPGVGARKQVDGYGAERAAIIDRVGAATALQRVAADAAGQRIVAGTAVDQVVVAIARQGVRLAGAAQRSDSGQHVILRVAAGPGPGREVDHDALPRVGVVGRIRAASTDQGIGTDPAGQRVIAGAAVQQIVGGVAR